MDRRQEKQLRALFRQDWPVSAGAGRGLERSYEQIRRQCRKQEEQMNVGIKWLRTGLRPVRVAVLVALLIVSVSITALAYGEQLFVFFSKGSIDAHAEGAKASWSVSVPEDVDGTVTQWEDGSLYFIANGEKIDITAQISEEKAFLYTCVDEEGRTHYFGVGGLAEPGSYGWQEAVISSNGNLQGVIGRCGVSYDSEAEYPWENIFAASLPKSENG